MISLLTFTILGAGAATILRDLAEEHHYQGVQSAARRVAINLREERLPTPVPPDPGGINLVQVVHTDGRVVNATDPARNGRLSSARPSESEQVRDTIECRPGQRCQLVHVIRAALPHHQQVLYVYAAKDVPIILMSAVLELLIAALVLVLTGATAAITWKIVGRTLASVEAIRAQLAEFSMSDLGRRVPEPGRDDEIARVARTANQILDRLQTSVERQRRFSADAAHELRTPIAGLRFTLEDAAMYPDDTDLPATIDTALKDIDRLESITADLLLLARLGTGQPATQQRIDLAELTTIDVRSRQADIRTNLTPGIIATGIPGQLMRLLANLLDNAQQHADNITEVELSQDGESAVLAVTDDGPGIPHPDRERVFERFTRLDTARSRHNGGTGLGLAIARDIAHAHGGTLRIEDSPYGARFVLRLPANETAAVDWRRPDAKATQASGCSTPPSI